MIKVIRKSTSRPAASVKRPSPRTPSSRSNTCGCAFSISSSSTTDSGCARTFDASDPELSRTSSMRRNACPAMNSLMSSRIIRCSSPNRYRVSCLASSVFPTPVGPTKSSVPTGRSGSLSRALSLVTTRAQVSQAASCPTTLRRSSWATASAGSSSSSASSDTGSPE